MGGLVWRCAQQRFVGAQEAVCNRKQSDAFHPGGRSAKGRGATQDGNVPGCGLCEKASEEGDREMGLLGNDSEANLP